MRDVTHVFTVPAAGVNGLLKERSTGWEGVHVSLQATMVQGGLHADGCGLSVGAAGAGDRVLVVTVCCLV